MYDSIRVEGKCMEPEHFRKGLAIEIHGNELSLYPVNLTVDELYALVGALKDLKP